jgi:NADH-quinone oxidoreductase subunit N
MRFRVPVEFAPTAAELTRFLPEIVLTLAGVGLMVLDALTGRRAQNLFGGITIAALLAALAGTAAAFANPGPAFSGMLLADGFAAFFRTLVIVAGILTALASRRYLAREGADAGEYHALLLFSIVGQCIMVTGNELIVLFLGLEISSISSYILTGYLRDDRRSSEAALKYFLLGSFATAFLLYGVAFLYGITGSTSLPTIGAALTSGTGTGFRIFAGIAAALIFVGAGFKVSGAPFQMWAPDVYQGAPAPVSAFLSTGPKAAAFALLLRVFITALEPIGASWEPLIWLSALLSMIIGNFAALLQTDIKRMLAYSSIAHAGYVLVAIAARSQAGTAAVMFYLAAYLFMNVGAFAVVAHLAGKGERHLRIEDFSGLAVKQPLTAALLAIFIFSLIGVPLTAGFLGKFYIFQAALASQLIWLTVLGLLSSAVAAYYYLRVLVVMYMQEPGEATLNLERLSVSTGAALLIPAIATLLLGIVPGPVQRFAAASAALLK